MNHGNQTGTFEGYAPKPAGDHVQLKQCHVAPSSHCTKDGEYAHWRRDLHLSQHTPSHKSPQGLASQLIEDIPFSLEHAVQDMLPARICLTLLNMVNPNQVPLSELKNLMVQQVDTINIRFVQAISSLAHMLMVDGREPTWPFDWDHDTQERNMSLL